MFTKKRPDGTFVRDLHFFTRLMPYIIPRRSDAVLFYEQEFDVTKTLKYVRNKRAKGGHKISLFYILLYAALRSIAQRPKMNRFVSGFRFYQRNNISFNFVVKRDLSDEGEEINATQSFSPLLSLEEFCSKIDDYITHLKEGSSSDAEKLNSFLSSLPRFCIKFIFWIVRFLDYHNGLPKAVIEALPFYSTVFFANVGSVGIDAPFHHHFEIGTCGIFIAIGRVRKESIVKRDGSAQTRDKLKLTFTFDDRITDGIYCARAVNILRDLTENPEKLEQPLELTPEQLSALCLADSELALPSSSSD